MKHTTTLLDFLKNTLRIYIDANKWNMFIEEKISFYEMLSSNGLEIWNEFVKKQQNTFRKLIKDKTGYRREGFEVTRKSGATFNVIIFNKK